MSFVFLLLILIAGCAAVLLARLRPAEEGWLAACLVGVRVALGLLVLFAVVGCVRAATGHGRIGSASVGVGDGLVVRTYLDADQLDEDAAEASTPEDAARVRAAGRALTELTISSGEPAEIDGTSVLTRLQHPTARQKVLAVLAAIAAFLPLMLGGLLLERILRTARGGDAFSAANVSTLQRLAVIAVLGSYGAGLVDFGVAAALADGRFDGLHVKGTFGLGPIVVGALLLALAEVWRHGLELRADVEATV